MLKPHVCMDFVVINKDKAIFHVFMFSSTNTHLSRSM